MQRFIMLVGIPASGKSTFSQSFDLENGVVLSSDKYREELLGDESNQTNNEKVFRKLYKDLDSNLKRGKSVVLDATNINIKARKPALDIAKKYPCSIEAIVFPVSYFEAVVRNNSRRMVVPDTVIWKMITRYECPQYFEGFDSIYFFNTKHANFLDKTCLSLRCDIKDKMKSFDQKNHHHANTLGDHCSKLADFFIDDPILFEAGLWHDVGKMFTQSFKINDPDAHYYQHANVSAYYLTANINLLECMGYSFDECLEIIFYINQHMHIRDIIKSEKALDKYKELYGETRVNNLISFMEKDNEAAK